MINCPNCDYKYNKNIGKCPACGHIIDYKQHNMPKYEKTVMTVTIIICLLIVVAAIIFSIWYKSQVNL